MTTPTVTEVRMTAADRAAMMRNVECPTCKCNMPAGRLAPNMLDLTFGVCGHCAHEQRAAAEVPAPMYETDAWSRGIKL